jgi:hypothetical protein
MKKILGLLLLTTQVFAATYKDNNQNQFLSANAPRNYILNSGAEKNDANVTDSSSIHSRSTSSPLIGEGSHLIDGTSTSQNVDFAASNLESGLLGTQCEATFILNGDASLYTANVRINSADVTTAQTLANTGSYSKPVSILFPCGTSGVSPVLRITSTSASAAAIKIDSVYLGKAVSLGNINQVGDWQSFTPTLSTGAVSGTVSVNKAVWRRVGDSMEIRWDYEQTAAGTAGSGNYYITVPNGATIDSSKIDVTNNSHIAVLGNAYIYNGTTEYTGTAVIQSSTQLAVNIFTTISATATWSSSNASFGNTTLRLHFHAKVPILGWTANQSYSLENSFWKVDANISGANPSLGTADVSSFTGIEDAGLTLTNNSGSGNITAQIPCSSTNSPSGTTCAAGSESVGVAFTPLGTFPQDVLACASFTWEADVGSTVTNRARSVFQVIETPTNAQTLTQEGKSRIYGDIYNSSGAATIAASPFRVCGTFTFSSGGQKVLRLMYEQLKAGTITSSQVKADASGTVGQRDIHWEVYPINQGIPAPLLVGSVTSNTTGLERIERAELNCDGSSSITSQSGSWISSIGNIGSGRCTVTIASGIFSSTPVCVATVKAATTTFLLGTQISPTSSTSFTVGATYITGGSATVTATTGDDFDVICMGPR